MIDSVEQHIPRDCAATILREYESRVHELTHLPPGDTRRSPSDPKFRQQAQAHAQIVVDTIRSPEQRLAHLAALLYQVRCSLIHGSKDPASRRDRMLVKASNVILSAIVAAIESAFDGIDREP